MQTRRIEWVDIAKGIAIFLMIAGHISIFPWNPVRKIIFSFHMPMFFLLSGYTSGNHYQSFWTQLRKNANNLILPYCYVSVICSVIFLLGSSISFSSITMEIQRLWWGSGVPAGYGPGRPVFDDEIPVTGAIWFLPCMYWAKLIFSVIMGHTTQIHEISRAGLILVVAGIGYLLGQHIKLPLSLDISCFVIVYIYAGYLLRKWEIIDKKLVMVGLVAFLLWLWEIKNDSIELSARFYQEFPMCIPAVLGAISGSYLVCLFSKEVLDSISFVRNLLVFAGKNSLYILCFHHIEGKILPYARIYEIFGFMNPYLEGFLMTVVRIFLAVGFTAGFLWLKKRIFLRKLDRGRKS